MVHPVVDPGGGAYIENPSVLLFCIILHQFYKEIQISVSFQHVDLFQHDKEETNIFLSIELKNAFINQ